MASNWKNLTEAEKDAYRKEKREHAAAIVKLVKALQERAKVDPADREIVLKAVATFHSYSMANAMLIYVQKHDAMFVAGFHQWAKHGRRVCKGEHGLLIWIPTGVSKKGEDQPVTVEEPTGFIMGTVFDIGQTEPIAQAA